MSATLMKILNPKEEQTFIEDFLIELHFKLKEKYNISSCILNKFRGIAVESPDCRLYTLWTIMLQSADIASYLYVVIREGGDYAVPHEWLRVRGLLDINNYEGPSNIYHMTLPEVPGHIDWFVELFAAPENVPNSPEGRTFIRAIRSGGGYIHTEALCKLFLNSTPGAD